MADDQPLLPPETANRIEELLHQTTYRPEEAAALLGMDVQRIYAAAFSGQLRARIVGQDVISVDRVDLIAWLRGGR